MIIRELTRPGLIAMHYNDFSIGTANDKYRLNVGQFTGEGITDWFNHYRYLQDGTSFSASDNANDRTNSNCAASSKSGWWFYRNCDGHNFNSQPPQVGGSNIFFTEMKIRPKDCITNK